MDEEENNGGWGVIDTHYERLRKKKGILGGMCLLLIDWK